MLTLTIDTGSGSDLTYQIGKETISIGASSGNDVILRAPGVAPTHVLIRRSGEVFTFQGQQRQVVVLNGERRSRGVLKDGDKIRIGTATLVFREDDEEMREAETSDRGAVADDSGVPPSDPVAEDAVAPKAEVVLYSESQRLTEGRRHLVELFRASVRSELAPSLETFFSTLFAERRSMLAWLDEGGRFQPIASRWTGSVPRLPARTFAELDGAGRFAVMHRGALELLIYPIPCDDLKSRAYLLVESGGEDLKEDRLLLAELARMLAVHWERVERMSSLFGPWERRAKRELEARLPGTSQAVQVLRDHALAAARSSDPVLLHGRAGTGRTFLAFHISWLRPIGEPSVHMVQVRGDDEAALRVELFGAAEAAGASSLAERAGGGVVVVRDIQRMPLALQKELAAVIGEDLDSGYGPSVRWVATTEEDCMGLVANGGLDGDLFSLFQNHVIHAPPLGERREDLPLIIVRLLETLASEQGKEIRGIDLDTLGSLLQHPFDGQMTELLGELRRLVSATPGGETIHGSARPSDAAGGGSSTRGEDLPDAAALLAEDDLKQVIPAAERLVIDRVLRRTLGNQSKAARELNLSRGSLIAKIKEYEIPDYRSLRRNR